jgi:hypothetical protein
MNLEGNNAMGQEGQRYVNRNQIITLKWKKERGERKLKDITKEACRVMKGKQGKYI